ncbi:MAG: metallophosphoesterase [Anaerolineae bacterium]|nr:metallophosphoesterase [Anaerolineae bacterium]
MVTALFTGLDYVWLIMLNWLKQSYGPPLLTWLVWAAARTALLFAWLFINRINQTIFQIKAVSWKVWLTANLFLFLLGGYAFYVEPFLLMDTFHEIKTQNIQSGARFRVVQVSDIHVERMTRREYALIRHVNNLKPDIVVVTGDYPNLSFINDVDTWDQITYIINHFEAPYGVYLINGSNETPERVRKLAKDSHAIALTDQVFHVNWQGGNVVLMGVNDIHFHQPPVDNFRVLSKEVNEDEFVILLHHTPDLAEAAYDQKVDLYLAGHTHGGQIRVPFYGAVFTSSIFAKKYEMGTYLLKNMTLYVNRGVGMEGLDAPRARFLAPPEVVVFDLLGTGQ